MGTTKNNIINGNEIKRKSNELRQLGWTLDIHVVHYCIKVSIWMQYSYEFHGNNCVNTRPTIFTW